MTAFAERTARVATALPKALHYEGEPTEWVRLTRPGQRLHSFLEGLALAPDGSFYLADVPHGRIFRVAPDFGSWSEAYRYDGQPHGLAFATDGGLLIADYARGILKLDLATGGLEVLCADAGSGPFRGLSDLALDAQGDLWFTDSGRTSLSDPTGRLFRLSKSGVLDCVLANVPYPNGVAISADGAHVFVAATRANAVWRLLRVSPESPPMAGIYLQMSGGLGPDGLAVSARGDLAVAHAQSGSAWIFDRVGDPRVRVRTPSGLWTTSVRFDPAGGRLFIVEAQSGSLLVHDLDGLKG